MASYQYLSQHTNPRFESPAKVFAKLKSKVQREGMYANGGVCAGREHGAEFKSPRKRTESAWMTDELRENQAFGSLNEAQALTISPISSPQKAFGNTYSDTSSYPAEEVPPVAERGHGCTPRKGASLESTALSQPFSVSKKQIHTEAPQIRELNGFNVTSRTPAKVQPVENDCMLEKELLMSSASLFSPMRQRLRKRKLEPWGFTNVNSHTEEVSSDVISLPQKRKTYCVFSEGETLNSAHMEDLVNGRGFSAGRSEMHPFTRDPAVQSPRSFVKKCCNVVVEKLPPMSPAKMFAYMKERESKAEHQEVGNVSSRTRNLFGNFHQSRDTPQSTVHNITEDITVTSVVESVVPVSQSRMESADNQSDPSKDILIPTAPPQPVLLEDPLILNSPRISIPKKSEAVLKRNNWPGPTEFPNESVIYLNRWFLRRNHKGLFVDGIHREENIPWNSNIIVDRVSNCVLKTISGRVYILVGKMNLHVDSGLPSWFLKKFVNGFPPNWKGLYEKFLSESRNRETERNSEGRGSIAKTKSEASSNSLCVKRQHRTKPSQTPDTCPPSSSSSKMSRSGRVIKPPLEYWKGGRVILDAHMNVTIHECYDTSICNPEVKATVSARASQTPVHVFLPCSKDHKQCESTSDNEASVPLRKVKAPVRGRKRSKVNHDNKPCHSYEPSAETLRGPEEWSGRRTRSNQRCPAAERTLTVDADPQKHVEKPSTWRKKKQKHDTKKSPVRVSGRKQAVPKPPESPTLNSKMSQGQASNDGLSNRRTKRGARVHRKNGEESQPSHLSEDSGKELRKGTRVTKNRAAAQTTEQKQKKSTKISQYANPLPKSTQSKKQKANKGNALNPQEQDEDQWTEAELLKLKEAVAFCPKHLAGYWAKVARIVGTRSAEECHNQHTSQGTSQSPAKKHKKKPLEAPLDPDNPVISARVGTLKRKQQVRQFLETMPRENVDDVFSCPYMQNKRFEIPSVCASNLSDDHDFTLSELEPMTPVSTRFPEVKTPQCLHITPGMLGSPNRNSDDKYVYQLQKRMKKSQFNVCKPAPSSKSFTPTPSVKRTMRRCGNTENDTFVVWDMFPGDNGPQSESREEEDFYFSDHD